MKVHDWIFCLKQMVLDSVDWPSESCHSIWDKLHLPQNLRAHMRKDKGYEKKKTLAIIYFSAQITDGPWDSIAHHYTLHRLNVWQSFVWHCGFKVPFTLEKMSPITYSRKLTVWWPSEFCTFHSLCTLYDQLRWHQQSQKGQNIFTIVKLLSC